MGMNLRRASLMVDILMPVSILLIFYPPCLQWYASGVMSIVFLLQKGLFLVCAAYALKYRLYRNKYMVALLSYIVWLILVTYLNGMQIGDIGSYLNVFSCCVVYVYCLERNPQRIIGYTSIVFTLLLLFNTILWKDGGMYVNNGYYEQANKIVNLVVNVISAYTVVMRSRMSALFAQKRNEEIQEKMAVSYNVIAFLVFPMTFGIAAIAAGMVPWFFGDGYDAVIGLLYIFCPIFIFMGYSRMIGTHILTPSGRQQYSNYAQIIAAVVNITLNSLLIPRFFAKGAAVASVTAELVLVLVYYYMVRKEILLKQVIEMGWKKAIAAGIMFVFVFTIGKNFSISIFYTFVEILIGAIVYVIVLVVLRDAFVCKYIDKTFHKILGQRRK